MTDTKYGDGLLFMLVIYLLVFTFVFIDVGFSSAVPRKSVVVEIPYSLYEWKVGIDIRGRRYYVPCSEEFSKTVNLGDTIIYYQKIGYITGGEWNKVMEEQRWLKR